MAADDEEANDIVEEEIRHLRPGLYRRLRCERKVRPDSPLVHPPAGYAREDLFGNAEQGLPYNPLPRRRRK